MICLKQSPAVLLGISPVTTVISEGASIPVQRKHLAVPVTTGKAEKTIHVRLTHEQVKRLTDKEVGNIAKGTRLP